jgi:putative DNA primase/helicase
MTTDFLRNLDYAKKSAPEGSAAFIEDLVLKRASRDIIIDALLIYNYSPSFVSILDSKKGLTLFSNYVYDCNEGTTRECTPYDYISLRGFTEIIPRDAYLSEEEGTIRELLKIFPDPDVLRFWLTSISLFLVGRNSEKLVYVWLGGTDSGKSTCEKLIEMILGEYCGVVPGTIITSKRASPQSATPVVTYMKGKRVLFIQEPEERKINSSQLKIMAGNDKQYTRQIYERSSNMEVGAITVIAANGHMDLTKCDEAAMSRLIVIPFESVFITSRMSHKAGLVPNGINIFEADKDMDPKLEKMAPHVLYMLMCAHTEYMENGLIIPPSIRRATDEYHMHCNPTLAFIRENLERAVGETAHAIILYEIYKGWLRKTCPSERVQSLQSFLDSLKSNNIPLSSNLIQGYRIKDQF